jgi:hypothetical protein
MADKGGRRIAKMTPGPRMHISIPKSYWRIFNLLFYEAVFLLLVFYAISLVSDPGLRHHPWLIGDWLTNYQGGFVRRGLVGDLLLRVSSLTGIEIGILVVVLQLLLYLVFLKQAYSLSANSSFTPLNAMLICSPAFILFPILDQYGGFRKELLLFVLLSVLCNRLADSRVKIPKYLPAWIGWVCVVIVLSHEMLIVYFPYLICAFVIHDRKLGAGAKRTALFMIPAAMIVVLVVVFGRGDKQVVIDICNSLKTSAPPDCLFPDIVVGAISFLDKDMIYAHSHVLEKTPPSTLLVYAVSAILSFTPLVLKLRSKQFTESLSRNSARVWFAVCICSALAASLPLLWIVADYGRLIYIHVTCLSLLTLMATQERNGVPLHFRFNLLHIGVWVLAVLFIVGWRLLHMGATPQEMFTLYSMIGRIFGQ